MPAPTRTWPIERFGLGPKDSLVVEVASNDGYLLQHFVERGIPVLGIEPAANVARGGAWRKGIPTRRAVLRARDAPRARRRGHGAPT